MASLYTHGLSERLQAVATCIVSTLSTYIHDHA